MRPLYFTIVLPHGPIILYDEGYIFFQGNVYHLWQFHEKKLYEWVMKKKIFIAQWFVDPNSFLAAH